MSNERDDEYVEAVADLQSALEEHRQLILLVLDYRLSLSQRKYLKEMQLFNGNRTKHVVLQLRLMR